VLGTALVYLSFAAFFSWAAVVILGRIRGINNILSMAISWSAIVGGLILIWWVGEVIWWRWKNYGRRHGPVPRRTQWATRVVAFWVFIYFLIYLWVFYDQVRTKNPKYYNFVERTDWRVLVAVMASQLPLCVSVGILGIDSFLYPVHSDVEP
jgi:hypothetical protein